MTHRGSWQAPASPTPQRTGRQLEPSPRCSSRRRGRIWAPRAQTATRCGTVRADAISGPGGETTGDPACIDRKADPVHGGEASAPGGRGGGPSQERGARHGLPPASVLSGAGRRLPVSRLIPHMLLSCRHRTVLPFTPRWWRRVPDGHAPRETRDRTAGRFAAADSPTAPWESVVVLVTAPSATQAATKPTRNERTPRIADAPAADAPGRDRHAHARYATISVPHYPAGQPESFVVQPAGTRK